MNEIFFCHFQLNIIDLDRKTDAECTIWLAWWSISTKSNDGTTYDDDSTTSSTTASWM
jgi:hypothetical protein